MYTNVVFEQHESQARSYCRRYPVIFEKGYNSELYDVDGRRYIDFLAAAGSMNYGHNNHEIKQAIVDYLSEDNVINMLDMYTTAKAIFLSTLDDMILRPRGLSYKMMCCGPTGTNAVEAALKLARKNTGREDVVAFGGAFHGMTLGSLACTTDRLGRNGAGVHLDSAIHIPYDSTRNIDSLGLLEWMIEDDHSGYEKPAAVVLETVQAEGGVNVASIDWLKGIREICTREDIIMVVDDIQVGNGRCGDFFSFERADIRPDITILSKSISGFGTPMSILLIDPRFDTFKPAEHNGTFRGNQLGFVGGTAGIKFFVGHNIDELVHQKQDLVKAFLDSKLQAIDRRISIRGLGLIWGVDFTSIDPKLALEVVHECFNKGLILEVAGRHDGVVKIMPPLTIQESVLEEGLSILTNVINELILN